MLKEKYPSWSHQAKARDAIAERKAVYLAYEMGTGKTKATIDGLAASGCRRILVLAPKSVLGVWRRELRLHWPDGAGDCLPVILDQGGSIANKAKRLKKCLLTAPAGTSVWVVCNYESAWRPGLKDELMGVGWDAIVLDESHRCKSYQAKCTKFATHLSWARPSAKRICLSGTPMPHSPLDIFSQCRFLDEKVFGNNYVLFRSRYAITDPMFPSKVRRWQNLDDLRQRFEQVAIVCRASEVLDLPEIVHAVVPVELEAAARRVYTAIEDELVAAVSAEGSLAESVDEAATLVVAPIVLTKLLRLQQVTCGVASGVNADGARVETRIGGEKAEALQGVLEMIRPDPGQPEGERAVVFCRFQADLDAVHDVCGQLGLRCGEISGRRRKDLTREAKFPPECDVLAVQIQSGGVGIDLTAARHGIYYSVGYSLGDYEQSVARLHRPGQKFKTLITHLVATDTVDEAIYDALRSRRDLVQSVVGRIAGVTEEVAV